MNDKRVLELLTRKIAGEISLEELRELEDLFDKNPDIVYYEQFIKEIWNRRDDEPLNKESDIDNQFNRHLLRHKNNLIFNDELVLSDVDDKGKSSIKSRKYLKYSFLLIVLVVMGVVLFEWNANIFSIQENKVADTIEILTRKGVKKQITLPDGTKVWLNADSKLSYNNSMNDDDIRSVSLEGEAYFDVVKDANRPFFIKTEEISIKVLGTAFNVKAYPDDEKTETTLIRGAIELVVNERPDEKFMLKPSEKLEVTKHKMVGREKMINNSDSSNIAPSNNITLTIGNLSKINIDDREYIQETLWIDNKLVFRDETLEEIIPKLERWYNLDIEITDIKLNNYRYTGTIAHESIDQVLTAMQLIKPFHFKIQNDDIILY